MRTGIVRSAGGSALSYLVRGDPHGLPIFWCHGTPGCRLSLPVAERDIVDLGARVITYDRPGYARSPRRTGRQVAESALDIAAIADDLGLDSFMIIGRSGGAPHALAASAGLPDRVRRVHLVGALAPRFNGYQGWFDGMDASNVAEFQQAIAGEAELSDYLASQAELMLNRVDDNPASFLDDFSLPADDRDVASVPLMQATLRTALHEALRAGIGGWVDDDLAIVGDWGFALTDAVGPVEIEYGLDDVIVPPGHSQWLAGHLPQAVELPRAATGHLSGPAQELRFLRQVSSGLV